MKYTIDTTKKTINFEGTISVDELKRFLDDNNLKDYNVIFNPTCNREYTPFPMPTPQPSPQPWWCYPENPAYVESTTTLNESDNTYTVNGNDMNTNILMP